MSQLNDAPLFSVERVAESEPAAERELVDAAGSAATSAQRVRFVQREEFRGSLAESLRGAAEEFTRQAFRAMNEALAARVRGLGKNA